MRPVAVNVYILIMLLAYVMRRAGTFSLDEKVKLIEKDWVGIIHHTSSTFSDNNINNLFKRSIFVNSLKHCKGLIVLSVYNKKNLEIFLIDIFQNLLESFGNAGIYHCQLGFVIMSISL